jgi:DtxR family Mn-dependent transcriptional regulator
MSASSTIHSPATQDYLRAIYQLASRDSEGGRVTTSRLAEWLSVRPASVTVMLQKMAGSAPALVDYHKSHGARLTAAGERAALAIVRCHRLMELYLHQKLGYTWDEVHEEADRLEHVISPALADRLAEALGHPSNDPHGHAIPSADLVIHQPSTIALGDLGAGDVAIVDHVHDEEAGLLRALNEVGIRPGSVIEAIGRDPVDRRLWLRIDGRRPVALTSADAGRIFVRPAGLEIAPTLVTAS